MGVLFFIFLLFLFLLIYNTSFVGQLNQKGEPFLWKCCRWWFFFSSCHLRCVFALWFFEGEFLLPVEFYRLHVLLFWFDPHPQLVCQLTVAFFFFFFGGGSWRRTECKPRRSPAHRHADQQVCRLAPLHFFSLLQRGQRWPLGSRPKASRDISRTVSTDDRAHLLKYTTSSFYSLTFGGGAKKIIYAIYLLFATRFPTNCCIHPECMDSKAFVLSVMNMEQTRWGLKK